MGQDLAKKFRANQRIVAPEVRIIGEGKSEVLTIAAALTRAQSLGLDLVEVAGKVTPPIVKIVDFKKFLYQESKKEHKKSLGTKSKLKEIRLSPIIAKNDLANKVNRGKEFLNHGDQLKINVWVKGRLAAHPEVGVQKMQEALKLLEGSGRLAAPAKWHGRYLYSATLSPK